MMETVSTQTFGAFVAEAAGHGGFHNDDVVAIMAPLLREVIALHEQHLVAPTADMQSLWVTNGYLDIDETKATAPHDNIEALSKLLQPASDAFLIVDESKIITDTSTSAIEKSSLDIETDSTKPITRPVYLPGYTSFEHAIGHHDALTDIFSMGMVLASLSTGLDMDDADELKTFVSYRTNLASVKASIHPAIANLIVHMTELDRSKRTRDLHEALECLKNYRDYNPEHETDLTQLEGFRNQDISSRGKWILHKLKSRLFDISRRNRLLYFKPNLKFLNLTVSSVPATLNYRNIDPNSLFIWNEEIAGRIREGKPLALSKYLRFEDNPYIPSTLDKIRGEAQRDVNEYGFSQLRLVIASLNWVNLKEDRNEKINSPLLLVPVELKKKKGVKDQYTLEITGSEAEVNPVLVYWLSELYNIKLPDRIVLEDLDMQAFFESIRQQVDASSSGISIQYIDKPRIKLIHSIARQTLSQFNRRLKRNKSLQHYKDVEYSYERSNFMPLGLQLYKSKVQPTSSTLEFLINEDIKLSTHNLQATEKERSLFTVVEDAAINPYLWEFDTCNQVLGNFNYKKMSLVRDYNEVMDENITSEVVDQLFSSRPKDIQPAGETPKENLQAWFPIIACDPTQAKAVREAYAGKSYIIQGPPGTGKSQTITNLIAGFVAQGKRVLFVCEKRAAIDVVYHRLRQQQLDELCCLIHDSQTDKKSFILDLKSTYEAFVEQPLDMAEIKREREKLLHVIETELAALARFNHIMSLELTHVGASALKLLNRLIALRDLAAPKAEIPQELIPTYKVWAQYKDAIHALAQQLKEFKYTSFAAHPASSLKKQLYKQDDPAGYIRQLTQQLEDLLENISSDLSKIELAPGITQTFGQLTELAESAVALKPLAENGNMALCDPQSTLTRQYEGMVYSWREWQQKENTAREKNTNWKDKFSEDDAHNALHRMRAYQQSFFRFLNPGYYALKRAVKQAYNFSAHQVKPAYTQVLEQLVIEYDYAQKLKDAANAVAHTFKVTDIDETNKQLKELRSRQQRPGIQYLTGIAQNADKLVMDLGHAAQNISRAGYLFHTLGTPYESKDLAALAEDLEDIQLSLKTLPELLPALMELYYAPEELTDILKQYDMNPPQLEKLVAQKNLGTVYQANRDIQKAEAATLQYGIRKLKEAYKAFYDVNAKYIRAGIRNRFNHNMQLSAKPASALTADEKQLKKEYTEGRRILEHEFGKTMRYRSIRDLASRESGRVIQDLKPVWLMSPLSVSDTLPVKTDYFDVVIFDEASQVTLEEGVPPLFRGKQAIVVGDEMQMPPSNFFGSVAPGDDEAESLDEDEDPESLRVDADSLLTQGSRKLPGVMLGWHYRSKFESLIGFSNAAFYHRKLLTIPDQLTASGGLNEIRVESANDAGTNVDCLFDRSISFHALQKGVYEKRTNTAEAEYIARLVQQLLQKETGNSIGVVAFSQEQQHEIEAALARLGQADKAFENRLEEEFQRSEDGQFAGLFIKNLENVQGDERDIIIMSICYGYDHNKRMLMNFGPINRKGGEKRLNVIFSRAKKHMAVVSSIQYTDIRNEHNEGANYFRRFLQYAELVSRGDIHAAATVLNQMAPIPDMAPEDELVPQVASQIMEALNSKGWQTGANVGQSFFRCSIGVRDANNSRAYCLGILIDTPAHYRNTDLLEQYILRPGVMESFNWNIIQVYTKDWYHQPEKVMQQIDRALKGEAPEEAMPAEPVIPFVPAEETLETREKTIPQAQTGDEIRLVYKDAHADKFWNISRSGHNITIRFGRNGTKGQETVKTFDSEAMAKQEMEKLAAQKRKKGYTR